MTELQAQPVQVVQENKEKKETSPSNVGSFSNLIVNYLPLSFRERHIRKLFSNYGTIESCRVMRFAQDGRTLSKGYGFVDFSTQKEAEEAIKALNGKNVLGKNLKVGFAKPSGQRMKSNLFVTHIPERWTEEDLDNIFGKYGSIIERRILRDSDGESRRSAFVRFDNNDQAKNAVQNLNLTRPSILHQPIIVRVAREQESSTGRKEPKKSKENNHNKPRRRSKARSKENHTEMAKPASAPRQNPVAAPALRQNPGGPRESMSEKSRGDWYIPVQPAATPPPQPPPSHLRQPVAGPNFEGPVEHFHQDRANIWSSPPRRPYRYEEQVPYYQPSRVFDERVPYTTPEEWDNSYNGVTWERLHQDPQFRYRRNYNNRDKYFASNGDPVKNVSKNSPNYQPPSHEVHFANLPPFFDNGSMVNMCSPYGEILEIMTTSDNNGRMIAGAVTLRFKNAASVDRAIGAFHGCAIGGRRIHCSRAERV